MLGKKDCVNVNLYCEVGEAEHDPDEPDRHEGEKEGPGDISI